MPTTGPSACSFLSGRPSRPFVSAFLTRWPPLAALDPLWPHLLSLLPVPGIPLAAPPPSPALGRRGVAWFRRSGGDGSGSPGGAGSGLGRLDGLDGLRDSGRRGFLAGEGDFLADEPGDGGQVLGILRRRQGVGVSRQSGAPGAADPVHVILGVAGDVEIEDVAHVHDIQAAGGHVAAYQELEIAVLEALQGFHARRLRHVPVQLRGVEPVTDQRAMDDAHVPLAVAENQCVLHPLGLDQAAKGRPLLLLAAAPGGPRGAP